MRPNGKYAELNDLLSRLCDAELEQSGWERLETLLLDDPDAQEYYGRFVALDVDLAWRAAENAADSSSQPMAAGRECDVDSALADEEIELPHASFPSLSPLPLPLSPPFVGGPVFSYMVATVVLCAMLLSAWAYKITHIEEMAQDDGKPSIRLADDPRFVFVGYVAYLKDCVWEKDSLAAMIGASVPMGREYELISGLMEIHYTSGARVILEGPCKYTVDSDAGGLLQLGKLVARMEKKVASVKPQAANSQSLIPNPQSLFCVTTPTAVVTDLGTEFGVSVDSSGNTASSVFEGAVRLQAIGDESRTSTILRAGEYARVERNNAKGRPRIVSNEQAGARPTFARRVKQPPEVIDLLDIVAGGNGITGLRERGIDPTTGKQDTWPLSTTRKGGKKYHPVDWSKFVDGVFTPYIKSRIQNPDVQLDSAGHIFKKIADHKLIEGEWISNNPSGKTVGGIWARGADCDSKSRTTNASYWMHNIRDDRQYMPEGRGLLGLHANAGITFDLEAFRREYEGARPVRFHAVAGLADGPKKYEDAVGAADLWIFVDGKLVWKRMYLKNQDGPVDVNVKLETDAKFISVVTTNCMYGYAYDYVVFGDPVLVMKSTESREDDN